MSQLCLWVLRFRVLVKRSFKWSWVQLHFNPTQSTVIQFPATEQALPQLSGNRPDLTTFSGYKRSFRTWFMTWILINTFHGQTQLNMKWAEASSQTTAKKTQSHGRQYEKHETQNRIYIENRQTLLWWQSYAADTETRLEKLKRKQKIGFLIFRGTDLSIHK